MAKTELLYPKNWGGHRQQWISHKMNIRHPWQFQKSKSWGPFWSYLLNSTANSAQLAHFVINCGSSKTTLKILIFSTVMGADDSFEVKKH